MPKANLIQILPEEIKTLLINFLDEDALTIDGYLLNLRAANRYFYNLINAYWANKYSIKQIMCATDNSYLLLQNGDLYGCGVNGLNSKLGLAKSIENTSKFIRIKQNIKQLYKSTMDDSIFLLLTKDNTLYGFGNSHHLGLNASQDNLLHTIDACSYIRKIDNNVDKNFGKKFHYNHIENFLPIAANITIKDLAVGNEHIVLLDQIGNVYVCGCNGFGQLGIGSDQNLDQFTNIFAKAHKIFATDLNTFILANGTLYGMGGNIAQAINAQVSYDDCVYLPTPMQQIPDPNCIKNIFYFTDNLFFLYDNGDLCVAEKDHIKLLEIDVEHLVSPYHYYDQHNYEGLLLLKKDCSLIYFRICANYQASQAFFHPIEQTLFGQNSNKLTIKHLAIVIGQVLLRSLPIKFSNYLWPKLGYISSSLVTTDLSGLSWSKNYYTRANTDPDHHFINGSCLLFSKDNGKKLYATGYNCLEQQLGLPESTTNEPQEVFNSLPIKNKLLQGRALLR